MASRTADKIMAPNPRKAGLATMLRRETHQPPSVVTPGLDPRVHMDGRIRSPGQARGEHDAVDSFIHCGPVTPMVKLERKILQF